MLETLQRSADVFGFLAGEPVDNAETGLTPHRVIHRQNKTCVRYFPPQVEPGAALRHPLFVSMPLINTWTVFDLRPGRSVVEKLTKAGVPVYMMDWGRAGPEDVDITFGDFADDVLPRALKRAARHARGQGTLDRGELLDALGYCVGGTVLAVTLARHPGLARRLALLAAPIDFHKSDRLTTWTNPETFPVDDIVDGFGNYPAHFMRNSFKLLKPSTNTSKWKGLWDRFDSEDFRDLWSAMERWNEDSVDFPGETYREYITQCYFNNALVEGGWLMNGTPVDLGMGTIPAIAFGASKDHICPVDAAFGLARAWGGPVETVQVKGGHVGVCIGKSFPTALLEWLARPVEPTVDATA